MVPVVFQDLYAARTFLKTKASRILHIKTFDTGLETLRVRSVIELIDFGEYNHYLESENQVFLNWNELNIFLEEVSQEEPLKTCPWSGFVLVFIYTSKADASSPNYSSQWKQLNDYVLTGSFAKVIIISDSEQHLDMYFKNPDDAYFTEKISETIHFGCLAKQTQTALFNLPCVLNENELLILKNFLHIKSINNPRLRTLFNSETLKHILLANEKIHSDQINYNMYSSYPDFYVQRKFVEYQIGAFAIKKLLTNPGDFCGLVIVGGIKSKVEIGEILKASRRDTKKILKNEYLLVHKKFHHAHRLFNHVKADVKMVIFIRYCSTRGFTWVHTKGCIDNFRDFFAEKIYCNERDLVRKKCFILSGAAGIGKTTTLVYLGNLLNAHRWIIFINFSKYRTVTSLPSSLTKESAVEFLWTWTDKHFFTKALLYDALFSDNARPVCLLIDEFNRTSLHEPWLRVLSFLKDFSKAYIWITARPIDVPVLENALSVGSTSLVEIQNSEEQNYLKFFIKRRFNLTKFDAKFMNFIQKFVEHSQHIFVSGQDLFGKFLFFKMFIDVNFSLIEEYCKKGFYANFQLLLNPFQVIEKFILHRGINVQEINSDRLMHGIIFPKYTFSRQTPLINLFHNDNYSITVAEYLLAKQLYSLMLTPNLSSKIINFLLTECLIKPQYSYVRIFLNFLFMEKVAIINEHIASTINNLWVQNCRIFFNDSGDWALIVLIKENLFEVSKWFLGEHFITHNAHIIFYQKGGGKTALNLAIDKKNTSICNAILGSISRVHRKQLIYNSLDNGARYIKALAKMNLTWVSDIIKTYEENSWKSDKFALYHAAKEGRTEVVKELVEAGANINNQTNNFKTALLISIQTKQFNTASYLLQLEQTDIFWYDKHGTSYLGQAAKFGTVEVAKALLVRGSDVNHRDKLGMSPLSWAVKMGHVDMINFLISCGADCFTRDNLNRNLIHVALKARRWDILKYLTFWQIDVSIGDLGGVTPLQRAFKLTNWAIVRHLILEGASIYPGYVRAAIKANQWNVVKIMLQKGVDIERFGVDEKNEILKHMLPPGDTYERISYFIQLGHIGLLETYIISECFSDAEVDSMLSELYEKHLVNKSNLSEDMKSFIEKKLYEIRAARGQQTISINEKSEKSLKDRLNFICEHIRDIKKGHEEDDNIDEKFLASADVIAQQIEVIKHHDKIKTDCPGFKETQFCLLLFLNYFREKPQDFEYALILNKCKIVGYLNNLLNAIETYFANGKFISQKQSSINTDFRLAKDIYSLKIIWLQIRIIQNETHPRHDIEVYALIRCLQVIGEYVKNTRDNQNLSDEVHKHLLNYAPTSIQQILAKLRDSIAHPKLLTERIKFEELLLRDRNVYENIKNDLKKILIDVEFILLEKKAEAIKLFMQNSDECACEMEFKKITGHFDSVRFADSWDTQMHICDEIDATVASIEELEQLLENDEKNILDKIEMDVIQFLEKTKSYVERVKQHYINIFLNFSSLLTKRNSTYLKTQICFIEKLETYYNRPTLDSSIMLYELMQINQRQLQSNQQDGKKIRINNILGKLLHIIQFRLYRAEKLEEIQGTLAISKNESPEEEKVSLLDDIFSNIRDKIKNQESLDQFDSFINESKVNHPILSAFSKSENKASLQESINTLSNEKLKTRLKRQLKKNFNAFKDLVRKSNLYGQLLNNITDIDINYYELLKVIGKYFASMENAEEINMAVNDFKTDQIKISANFYESKYQILDSVVKGGCDFTKPLLRAAVEILLLDILTYLADKQCLKEYCVYYEQFSPILINTALRNYLAHGNILTGSLPFDPKRSILNCISWLRKHSSLEAVPKQETGTETYYSIGNISNKFDKLKNKSARNFSRKYEYGLYIKFLKAAETGNIDFLRHILDNILCATKTRTSMVMFEGFLWPAIFYATVQGHRNVVVDLIDRANKSFPCLRQSTILVRLAKQTVARLDAQSWNASNNYDNILSLFHQTCLHEAAKSDPGILEDLLGLGDPDAKDYSGNTALIIAAELGRIDSVNVLLSHNADVNATNILSGTALQRTIMHGHENIAKLLIDSEANVEDFDEYGFSALFYSVTYGMENIVKRLLPRVKVDAVGHEHFTALHAAAENGREDILILLIQNGADVNAVNVQGSAALDLAISNGHTEIAKKLLQVENLNINKKDINQQDALYLAAERGMVDIVDILLNNGAEIESFDKNNRTALHAAAENGCISVVELLLDKQINTYAVDSSGNTALHLAIYQNQESVVELLLSRFNDLINATNISGYTPLHVSAMYDRHNLIELLINNGADFSVKDHSNNTTLHIAAVEGHDHVLAKLLSIPQILQSINETNGHELAPLHLSAYWGFDKTVECLLKKNAEVDVRGYRDATPLHLAAQSNHYNIVKMLLSAKADVNALMRSKNSALYFASAYGFERIVKLLLLQSPKPNINISDEFNHTPLLAACELGFNAIVKLLLLHGAEPNDSPALFIAAISGHIKVVKTLLSYETKVDLKYNGCTELYAACQKNHTEIATMLIENGADVNFFFKNKFSPLYIASSSGNKEICEKLIEAGAEVNLENENSFTSLHVSADKGHYNIVKLLLSSGASVNATSVTSKSALHFACEKGHKKVVSLLLKKQAEINAVVNDLLLTALHFAATNGHSAVVKLLIAKGADVTAVNHAKSSALHLASQNGHIKVVIELSRCVTVNINAMDADQSTSLFLAAKCNHKPIVEFLISKGADVNLCDLYQTTPLHVATVNNNKDIINILLKHGSNVNLSAYAHQSSTLQFRQDDNEGINYVTALHIATYCTDHTVIDILLQQPYITLDIQDINKRTPLHYSVMKNSPIIAEKLIKHGADINFVDKEMASPILLSVLLKRDSVFKTLFNYDANVNLTDKELRTPLHYSVEYNNESITTLLLQRVADINCVDKDKSTCLHIATKNGYLPIVKLLIEHGASVNLCDKISYTPLHYGAKQGDVRIIKILLAHEANANVISSCWQTPLMLLSHVSNENTKESTEILLKYGADKNASNINYITSLHMAAAHDNLEMVIVLLRHGTEINQVDENLNTALHYCAKTDNKLIAAYLIQNGIDLNALTISQTSALHIAALFGHTQFVDILLRCGTSVDVVDMNRRTPLQYATEKGHKDIVQSLLVNGADVNSYDTDLCTALHKASELGHIQVVKILLKHNAYIDLADINGLTPLHYSIQNNHKIVAEQLLLHRAKIEHSNLKCSSLLNIASSLGHKELVELLIRHGAKTTSADIFGRTALHYAAIDGHTDIVRILLTQAIDKDAQDYASQTALHYAAIRGFENVAYILIDLNANANLTNTDKRAPLHYAVESGNADLVNLLLPVHSDINATDISGETVLHIAVAGNHKDIVKSLIEHRAHVNAASTTLGVTPIHLAATIGDIELVEILVDNGADFLANDRYGRTTYNIAADTFGPDSDFSQALLNIFLAKMHIDIEA